MSGQLYLRSPWKNPFLPGSHTNFVFTHSGKRPAPVTDTISASPGCLLTGASTILNFELSVKLSFVIDFFFLN